MDATGSPLPHQGAGCWIQGMLFDHTCKALVQSNAIAVPAAETQREVDGLRGHYEVCLRAQNAAGWSDGSNPANIYIYIYICSSCRLPCVAAGFQTDVVSLAAALNGSISRESGSWHNCADCHS